MTTKERNQSFPSGLEAIFVVAALFGVEFLVGAAVRDARSVFGLSLRDFDVVVVLLGNGILFAALMQYKNLGYGELFHPSRNSVVATIGSLAVPILLIVPGLFLATSAVVALLASLVPLSRWEEAMFDRMMSSGLASVVTTCILAPIVEEMLFRGIILRSFLRQYSRWRAIFGSAALFGLAHLNIYQFVVGLVIGTVAGWIYERARSLWPCVLLHAAYNTCATALYIFGTSTDAHEAWQPTISMLGLLLLMAVVGAALLRMLLAARPRLGFSDKDR